MFWVSSLFLFQSGVNHLNKVTAYKEAHNSHGSGPPPPEQEPVWERDFKVEKPAKIGFKQASSMKKANSASQTHS